MHQTASRTLAALVVSLLAVSHIVAQEPMNIVVIIADDFGWADISANNPNCFYDTPSLDALARSGANFTRGYAAAPVCSPTRVSIMSGVNPTVDAATEWFGAGAPRSEQYLSADRINFLPTARPTLAEHLKPAGYETFFAGKWHLGEDDLHLPQGRGFDVNIAGSGRGNPGGNGGYFAPYADFIGLDAPQGEHLPARLTDETIRWISSRDGSSPFLAVLSYYSVHTPLQGREDLIEKYRARRIERVADDVERFADEEQVWPVNAPRKVRVVQDHPVYAAMVEAMDEHIGRLIDAIDQSPQRDRTLIVFVSDNGGLSTAEGSPTANTPLRGGKGWMYEGGIRVPFMLRWPGVTQPGSVIDTPAHTSDILPTILEAAGINERPQGVPAAPLEGRSLRTLAQPSRRAEKHRPLFFHYPHYGNQGGFPSGSIIRGDLKYLLRYADGSGHLYDLAADPGEQSDLTQSPSAAFAETAAAMRRELLDWLAENHARFLARRGNGPVPWQPESID